MPTVNKNNTSVVNVEEKLYKYFITQLCEKKKKKQFLWQEYSMKVSLIYLLLVIGGNFYTCFLTITEGEVIVRISETFFHKLSFTIIHVTEWRAPWSSSLISAKNFRPSLHQAILVNMNETHPLNSHKRPSVFSCWTCSGGRGGGDQSDPVISPSTSSTTYS